jgi:hypothetical protein
MQRGFSWWRTRFTPRVFFASQQQARLDQNISEANVLFAQTRSPDDIANRTYEMLLASGACTSRPLPETGVAQTNDVR